MASPNFMVSGVLGDSVLLLRLCSLVAAVAPAGPMRGLGQGWGHALEFAQRQAGLFCFSGFVLRSPYLQESEWLCAYCRDVRKALCSAE